MALVSNVHYNLSPWASGTFTLNQRTTNAGNVYQATTAGSSTGAPTGTGTGINNGGAAVFAFVSTYDYPSLQAWANALPATLTQPVVAQLWNNGPITTTSGTPFLTLTGHVTTTSNNITITCAPGEGFVSPLAANPALPLAFSQSAGVNFNLPATGTGGINYVSILDENVVAIGLQFQDPNPTSGSTIFSAGTTCTVQSCIFDGYGQTGGASILDFSLSGASGDVQYLVNSLVVDRVGAGGTATTIFANRNVVYANNTIIALNSPSGQFGIADQGVAAGITVGATNNIILGYPASSAVFTGASDCSAR